MAGEDEATRIARSLTDPQKVHIDALASDWEGSPPMRCCLDARVMRALDRLGLTTPELDVKLTPLGQRVAEILAGGEP